MVSAKIGGKVNCFKVSGQVSRAVVSVSLLLSVQAQAKLVVHEWGTFTSLVGSNGQAQNGMYHEDEALPNFVHNFGDSQPILQKSQVNLFAWAPPQDPPAPMPPPNTPRCSGRPKVPCEFLVGQRITQKMETPVVYFYSDVSRQVSFDVSFPGGIISQSYPAASRLEPRAIPGVELKNGFANYVVNILKNTTAVPPFVEPSNIYSHARNVASDLIQVGHETEKFIFYRGLGEFNTELEVISKNENLQIRNIGIKNIPAVFLVYTNGQGQGNILSLGRIKALDKIHLNTQTIAKFKANLKTHSAFLSEARLDLLNSLTKAGLFHDEALAMLNTWQNGYFKTAGLRILYVLNSQEVEKILPVRISPEPDQFSRVFVGRIEILLDQVEQIILEKIVAEGAQYDVSQLGRMAQPILLRVQELARTKQILTSELAQVIDELIARAD